MAWTKAEKAVLTYVMPLPLAAIVGALSVLAIALVLEDILVRRLVGVVAFLATYIATVRNMRQIARNL